jgi:hypothetical protein
MEKAREEPKREEKVCTSCEVNQAKSGHESGHDDTNMHWV